MNLGVLVALTAGVAAATDVVVVEGGVVEVGGSDVVVVAKPSQVGRPPLDHLSTRVGSNSTRS